MNRAFRLLVCNDCESALPGSDARAHHDRSCGKSTEQTTRQMTDKDQAALKVELARWNVRMEYRPHQDDIATPIDTRFINAESRLPYAIAGVKVIEGQWCVNCRWPTTGTDEGHRRSKPPCKSKKMEPHAVHVISKGGDAFFKVVPVVVVDREAETPVRAMLDQLKAMEAEYVPRVGEETGRRFDSPFITASGFGSWAHDRRTDGSDGVPKEEMQRLRELVFPGKREKAPYCLIRNIAETYVDRIVRRFDTGNLLVRQLIKSGK